MTWIVAVLNRDGSGGGQYDTVDLYRFTNECDADSFATVAERAALDRASSFGGWPGGVFVVNTEDDRGWDDPNDERWSSLEDE